MTTRFAHSVGPFTLGLSALLLGGTLTAVTTSTLAAASPRAQSRAEKDAQRAALAAQAALGQRQYAQAVRYGEAAVAYQPRVASYWLALGQTYLKAGRFVSARDAFAAVLTLDPGNEKAALQFALAQIATGDWAGARKTLDDHADTIAIADRGLATALAGDPAAAVALLDPVARSAASDAKLRQNYGLSLALAGHWREARTVAAIDLAPADVDQRILEWANFAQPKSASDQVATLLGVTPAVDPGVPVALALSASHGKALAVAEQPVGAVVPAAVDTTPQPVAVAVQENSVGPSLGGVVYAERKEVVQPLTVAAPVPTTPTPTLTRPVTNTVVKVAASRPVSKGSFYVQVGAFENASVARDAWGRVLRRNAAFAGHTPQGMSITASGKTFYRLSVGGFARSDAVALCKTYRTNGGTCFVRAGAGDQVALWTKRRELASR